MSEQFNQYSVRGTLYNNFICQVLCVSQRVLINLILDPSLKWNPWSSNRYLHIPQINRLHIFTWGSLIVVYIFVLLSNFLLTLVRVLNMTKSSIFPRLIAFEVLISIDKAESFARKFSSIIFLTHPEYCFLIFYLEPNPYWVICNLLRSWLLLSSLN